MELRVADDPMELIATDDSAESSLKKLTAPASLTMEVRTVGGDLLAQLTAGVEETVGIFRQRLLLGLVDEGLRRRYGQSRLVYRCSVLQEYQCLSKCCGLDATPLLTLVSVRPSSLASHMRDFGLEASTSVDVVDAVFQAEHAMSMRYRPKAQDITRVLPPSTRVEITNWLGIACDAMMIDDQLLHGAVLTLDRYVALRSRPVAEEQLLCLSLAALCTEMKLASADDYPTGYWQRLLVHLAQGREGLPEILQTEAAILKDLSFNVGVPTPLSFLRGLGLRFCKYPNGAAGDPGPITTDAATLLALARFFVELALFDVDFEYKFPPAVIAMGALSSALLAIGPMVSFGAVREGPAMIGQGELAELSVIHEQLLEDMSSYCPYLENAEGVTTECEYRLLRLWLDCSRGVCQWSTCYKHLCSRHARPARVPGHLDGGGRGLGAALDELSPEVALRRFHTLHEDFTPRIFNFIL